MLSRESFGEKFLLTFHFDWGVSYIGPRPPLLLQWREWVYRHSPAWVAALVQPLSFFLSFWDLCMPVVLFALYLVMMRFDFGIPESCSGGGYC